MVYAAEPWTPATPTTQSGHSSAASSNTIMEEKQSTATEPAVIKSYFGSGKLGQDEDEGYKVREDWGEQLEGSLLPSLYILSVPNGAITPLVSSAHRAEKNSASSIASTVPIFDAFSCGQPIFSPNGSRVIFVAWSHASSPLGLIYYNSRPSTLYEVELPHSLRSPSPSSSMSALSSSSPSPPRFQVPTNAIHPLCPSHYNAFSPRFSPCGRYLVWLSTPPTLMHKSHNNLLCLDWVLTQRALEHQDNCLFPKPVTIVEACTSPDVAVPLSEGSSSSLSPSKDVSAASSSTTLSHENVPQRKRRKTQDASTVRGPSSLLSSSSSSSSSSSGLASSNTPEQFHGLCLGSLPDHPFLSVAQSQGSQQRSYIVCHTQHRSLLRLVAFPLPLWDHQTPSSKDPKTKLDGDMPPQEGEGVGTWHCFVDLTSLHAVSEARRDGSDKQTTEGEEKANFSTVSLQVLDVDSSSGHVLALFHKV